MLEAFDPRFFLARCVRCGVRERPLCSICARVPLARARTPEGLPVWGLGPYGGYLAQALQRLKYQGETHLAFPLGRALRSLSRQVLRPGMVILPVPAHPIRLAERGYNQAALIASSLAERRGARVLHGCLLRQEERTQQARLSGKDRRSNLVGAFRARHTSRSLHHTDVFLLDDVVTTGSTIDACASALQAIDVRVSGILACAIARDTIRSP